MEAAVDDQRCIKEMRKTTTGFVQSTGSLFCVTNIVRHFARRLKCPFSDDKISPFKDGVCFYMQTVRIPCYNSSIIVLNDLPPRIYVS